MARPNPGSKSKARQIVHGKSIGGEPGAPNIVSSGVGLSGQGPTKIKGPGAQASVKGKTKGMGGK